MAGSYVVSHSGTRHAAPGALIVLCGLAAVVSAWALVPRRWESLSLDKDGVHCTWGRRVRGLVDRKGWSLPYDELAGIRRSGDRWLFERKLGAPLVFHTDGHERSLGEIAAALEQTARARGLTWEA